MLEFVVQFPSNASKRFASDPAFRGVGAALSGRLAARGVCGIFWGAKGVTKRMNR